MIYVFNNLGSYSSFLEHSTRIGESDKQCMQNGSCYTLTAEQNRNYLTGLYLQNPSAIESVEISTIGHEQYYDIDQSQPNCIIVSGLESKYTIEFEEKGSRYCDSDNVCILGSSPDNITEVTYAANGNRKRKTEETALRWTGVTTGICALVIFSLVSLIYWVFQIVPNSRSRYSTTTRRVTASSPSAEHTTLL